VEFLARTSQYDRNVQRYHQLPHAGNRSRRYAVANLSVGMRDIAAMGLSGTIEPLLSRSVIEDGFYVCFNKMRVSPALVDAFSRALRQFKQTEAFQAIYHKYFP
jgi:polar amino acid transport system substrate-binding protein